MVANKRNAGLWSFLGWLIGRVIATSQKLIACELLYSQTLFVSLLQFLFSGLYCVLQNYAFSNYLFSCEICLCGLFIDRLPLSKTSKVAQKAVCIGGTGLVGVGIHVSIQTNSSAISKFRGSTNFRQLIAAEVYEFSLKIWHWNRLGFVTVSWDLGNDSVRPNHTVEIQNNGFGFLQKTLMYSTPGVFRLRIIADDGFYEFFKDMSVEVVPSAGKTPITVFPLHPSIKETVALKTPEFLDRAAKYMWFMEDSVSFAESNASVATKVCSKYSARLDAVYLRGSKKSFKNAWNTGGVHF